MTINLSKQSILWHWHTAALLAAFFAARALSLALAGQANYQALLALGIITVFIIFFFHRPRWAWHILLGELLLGGAGHFFELASISLRTWLLIIFLTCWFIDLIVHKKSRVGPYFQFPVSNFQFPLLALLILWSILGSLHALEYDRSSAAIIADLIPYGFFLLLLPTPLRQGFAGRASSFKPDEAQKKFLIRLIAAFLIGSAIFSLITFVLFSNGIEVVQDPYYKWFRDVAFGKITDLGHKFWRIVLPEHLLIPPLMILLGSWLMRSGTKRTAETSDTGWYILLGSGALTLALNLSRTYFLGLLTAFLVLKYKHHWKNWLTVSLASATLIMVIFTGIHLIVSRGNTGWDLLGLRFGSIARPGLEESAWTRTALLTPIWQLIKVHPLVGAGLGASITFNHPTTGEAVTTRHLDWGYLELWAELGLIGVLLFVMLLVRTGIALVKKIRQAGSDYQDLYIGLLAILAALAVMNVTAPVLFHVLGVVALVLIIATPNVLSE